MEVREDDLLFARPLDLDRLGLLDLDDHVGLFPDHVGRADYAGSCRTVIGIADAAAEPRAFLYQYFVPAPAEYFSADRKKGDSMLVLLYLFRNPNNHLVHLC